jgi:outer membrane protein
MKKILSTLALAATMTTFASADMVRLEMGVGGWDQEPSGTITYTDGPGVSGTYTTDGLGETETYAWLLIKHPILIIPNLRLEYVNINDNGLVNGKFEDFETGALGTTASLSLKQYDIIPYYNLLDNTFWTTIDLGIDVKVVDSSYSADGVTIYGQGTGNYTDSKTIAIPMVYGRARVEIPGTGLGLESDVKYITYDGSTVYDVRAKVDYTFDLDIGVDPGIEVGYRTQKFDIKSDDDKTKMNMDFSGFYAGLMLRF